MALPAPFCPERTTAGLNEFGICRHCQRNVDRYLDLSDWERLEADRLTVDFDGYADPDTPRSAAA